MPKPKKSQTIEPKKNVKATIEKTTKTTVKTPEGGEYALNTWQSNMKEILPGSDQTDYKGQREALIKLLPVIAAVADRPLLVRNLVDVGLTFGSESYVFGKFDLDLKKALPKNTTEDPYTP